MVRSTQQRRTSVGMALSFLDPPFPLLLMLKRFFDGGPVGGSNPAIAVGSLWPALGL